ncbi:protein of unknown function [Streptantibioticus cattleyicolor NRRL 8057 = DSM 46488]|nr:protein of unknown function [Streptantibioticus cattleyicolor NRRL 8057 = DSM 46488]
MVTGGGRYIWKESSSDPTYDKDYYDHPGVAVVAGSGDWDYSWGVGYPSSSPYVTSVGGTSLVRASNSRGWNEVVWNTKPGEGTGSGCSAYEPKPSWQKDTGCAKRIAADVSASADPGHGEAVYDSYQEKGWGVYGGTSAATPIVAGVYADAGAPAAGSNPASYPYAHAGSLNDVTQGNNGSCKPAYFCTAGPGYDTPTGLSTSNGTAVSRPRPARPGRHDAPDRSGRADRPYPGPVVGEVGVDPQPGLGERGLELGPGQRTGEEGLGPGGVGELVYGVDRVDAVADRFGRDDTEGVAVRVDAFPWHVGVPALALTLDQHAAVRREVADAGTQQRPAHLDVPGVHQAGGEQHHVERLAEVEPLDGGAHRTRSADAVEHLRGLVHHGHREPARYERVGHPAHPAAQFEYARAGRHGCGDDVRLTPDRQP